MKKDEILEVMEYHFKKIKNIRVNKNKNICEKYNKK